MDKDTVVCYVSLDQSRSQALSPFPREAKSRLSLDEQWLGQSDSSQIDSCTKPARAVDVMKKKNVK